jgi:uncharacterized surface protein with fasciclin (FAS1) repeats
MQRIPSAPQFSGSLPNALSIWFRISIRSPDRPRSAIAEHHKRQSLMNTHTSNTQTNLVDTAASQGSFTIFGKALNAAGLANSLKDAGPYTVFAPTDAAFKKLPAGKLDNWMKPENKAELISILNYHVTPGRVLAADVGKLRETKTVQGQSAKIKMTGDKVTIDGANITLRDIDSTNGVIHAIDTVLQPTKH